MDEFTVIFSYYSQPLMLTRQLQEWEQYPPAVSMIVVDDGSPVPAWPIVKKYAPLYLLGRLRLYRILEDIPWARSTARNLAMQEAHTAFCVVTDLDHILPAACATLLLDFQPMAGHWYRFPRWRRGAADDTRNKDALPRTATHGKIHEHMDSYLIERSLYWEIGGYSEVFNGGLGGGSEFLYRLARRTQGAMLPENIFLEVYTKNMISDASITGLSRDTSAYSRRRRQLAAAGYPKPERVICLPWERVL